MSEATGIRTGRSGVSPRLERLEKHPGIYRRGGRYVAVCRVNGRQRKLFGRTIAEAKAKRAALVTDVRRGEHRELSQETFAAFAPEWIANYTGRTKRGLNSDTRDDYRKALERHAIPYLGRLRLSEIEPRDIKALARKISESGVSAGTVRLQLAPVKALLAEAFEEGLIRSNPAAGVRIARADEHEEEESEVRALSEEQLEFLLIELPADWRLFYSFLAETGLRIGEAIELRWGDVDFGSKRLRVERQFYRGTVRKPKGRKSRGISLSHEMAQLLWSQQGAADELVFTSEQGKRLDQSNLMSRTLKPTAVRAGLGEWVRGKRGLHAETWVGHHTFRHTCASRLFRSGWNPKMVSKFLGHTDAGFTLRTYVHLLEEDLPEPPCVGNVWATRDAETGRDTAVAVAAVSSA